MCYTNSSAQLLALSNQNSCYPYKKFSNQLFEVSDSLKKSPQVKSGRHFLSSKHQPKVAVILSAVIPGSGQIYNQKYWKTPVIWAGMGVCAYFIRSNHLLYKDYKEALLQRTDTGIQVPDKYIDIYSSEQLLRLQDQYRQNRDLFIIATSLVYVLNIVDALVDAHLFTFDVSDDLSLNWQPFYRNHVNTSNYAGVQLQLKFR